MWNAVPDSKVHEANMGPIWGRQDPDGPHVGPMNLDIWGHVSKLAYWLTNIEATKEMITRPHDLTLDDVINGKYFLHYRPFVKGVQMSPADSLSQRPVLWSFDISSLLTL